MKIEAVSVCVNYSDFLAHTLPHNRTLFDKLVIVTDTQDLKTKAICDYYNVTCVQTDSFYENGSKINKGKGINEGLKHLDRDGWVVHLDSDIYLPPLTRSILEILDLDHQTIYGIDRMMCPTYESWLNFIDSPSPLHEGWIYVHTTAFPMGVRIAEYKNKGWEPIGFFQMWHPEGSGVRDYPGEHGSVDRSDVLFAKKFPRAKRQLLPEIIAVHIDSEELVTMGKNWQGRQTAEFSLRSHLANSVTSALRKLDTPILSSSSNYGVSVWDWIAENLAFLLGWGVAIGTIAFYIVHFYSSLLT